MPFFNFLRRRGLQPSWEYTTQGNIWRLHLSSRGRLVGEERDAERKCATFFCIDLSTGSPLWKDKTFGDPWWTGIEAVHRDVVFLHGYTTPDMPEHKGMTAVDLGTGEVLWKDDRVTFIAASGEIVYASRTVPAGKLLAEIEFRTGAVVRERGGADDVANAVPGGGQEPTDVVLPSRLQQGASALAVLLRSACGPAAASGPVEYIVDNGLAIFGYHERVESPSRERSSWRSLLAVVDRGSGGVQLKMVLDDAVAFPGTDAFLVRDAMLYFVRRRRTLTAVALRDS